VRTTRHLGPAARTLILCGMGVLTGLVMVVTLVLSLQGTDTVAREQATRALPAQAGLRKALSASATGQAKFLTALATSDPLQKATRIVEAQVAGRARDGAWASYLEHALHRTGERALQRAHETASARSLEAGASVFAMSPADPAFATTLAVETAELDRSVEALEALLSRIYDPIVHHQAAAIVSGIDGSRTAGYVSFGAMTVVFLTVGLWLVRGARRDQRRLLSDAVAMRSTARYNDLETSLHRALEMEPTEEATYEVIAHALTLGAPGVPAELLLADSSQAHFRQVLDTGTGAGADAACGVAAPGDCPATTSGQTRFFEDSSQLDTCPYLRGRHDRVWALCVPVSIAGNTTGVVHTQGPADVPPNDITRAVELIGRKAGERIGMLRAFSRSETQARTDPLTGLLNRRSLEARTRDLAETGLPFVVAYGDLDQFKMLNDVHGHDAGDRALRLFARVLRDSVRPVDVPARYGGEEFVVALPDCSLDNAFTVIERIRSELRAVLANGTVPPFTVSFGIAASELGLTFSQTLEAADEALLHAKRSGRDRISIAGASDDDTTEAVSAAHG
jgi:diguanylate cyclase (GGDEF)-like protein